MTREYLKSLLHYDPETGVFTWVGHRCSTINGTAAGYDSAGSIKGKYRVIRIKKVPYLAHRLAWLYVYGSVPEVIDHANGDGKDNRLCNLRECDQSRNLQNKRIQSNNTSGVLGVTHGRNGTWRAYVNVNGRQIMRSGFLTVEDAAKARQELAIQHYGEFAFEARKHD